MTGSWDTGIICKGMRRAGWAGMLALVVVLCGDLRALAADNQQQQEQEEEETFEEKFIKTLLGGDRPQIDYRERSPLVVPPSRDLPPPESNSVVSNPAWPKDFDVQAAKKKKVVERRSLPVRDREDIGRALTPEELAVGRSTTRGGRGAPNSRENELNVVAGPLSPKELDYKGGLFKSLFSGKDQEASVPYPGEPPRANLTQPPPGYLTPSPNQPYGLSPTKAVPKPYRTTIENVAVGGDGGGR